MNRLIAGADIFSELKDKHILLDTCCLIHATQQPELLGKFLRELKEKGCDLLITPAVKLEFLRGADSFVSLRAREKYLAFAANLYPIEAYLGLIPEFPVVMQKVFGNRPIELSDYLLIACLVNHPKMYLLTENHNHMPLGILERTNIVTWDNDKDIKNVAFYRLNEERYQEVVSKILAPIEAIATKGN